MLSWLFFIPHCFNFGSHWSHSFAWSSEPMKSGYCGNSQWILLLAGSLLYILSLQSNVWRNKPLSNTFFNMQGITNLCRADMVGSRQGVTKRCRLFWLTNSAQMSPNAAGGGSCGVSANEYSCTQEPKETLEI